MDAVSSLPSLNDLLRQNPNLNPQKFSSKLNGENHLSNGISSSSLGGPPLIDKTTAVDRVTAPGFSDMFENVEENYQRK